MCSYFLLLSLLRRLRGLVLADLLAVAVFLTASGFVSVDVLWAASCLTFVLELF